MPQLVKNKATLNVIAATNSIGRNHQPVAQAANRISLTATDANSMERVAWAVTQDSSRKMDNVRNAPLITAA